MDGFAGRRHSSLAVPESYKGDAISRPVNDEQHTFLEIERQDQLTGAIQERLATERSGKIEVSATTCKAKSRSVTMPKSFLPWRSSQMGTEPIFSVFINLAILATVSVGTQQTGPPVITSLHFFTRFSPHGRCYSRPERFDIKDIEYAAAMAMHETARVVMTTMASGAATGANP